jgi:hypothetical protein
MDYSFTLLVRLLGLTREQLISTSAALHGQSQARQGQQMVPSSGIRNEPAEEMDQTNSAKGNSAHDPSPSYLREDRVIGPGMCC